MGCGDECPAPAGMVRGGSAVSDPKAQPLERVRQIRDEIRGRVEALIRERRWSVLSSRESGASPKG